MKRKFAPSCMCMDLLDIQNQIKIMNEKADYIHVDIMDGHFAPNITLSPTFIKAISPISEIPIDAHLMITNPIDYIDECAKAGAAIISPHAEAINVNAYRVMNKITDAGCKIGIVLNPATPLEYIKHYIHRVDLLTIMTVDIGFSGQPFIEEQLAKIKQASDWKKEYGYKYEIQIDGACNAKTYRQLNAAGAEVYIVGASGLFSLDSDLPTAWNKMEEIFDRETAKTN